MTRWIEQAMDSLGYPGIALLMFLENIFPPIPSELIMPLAGFATSVGELSFVGVVAAGTLGSVAGALPLSYEEDLSDLLRELRVLLPGVQMLTGFLILRRFSQGFSKIGQNEQWVYLALFVCSVSSLVLFTAPAAQHRLERPLRDRIRFKHDATRLIIIGLAPLSLALILATHLIVTEVIGKVAGLVTSAVVAALIALT